MMLGPPPTSGISGGPTSAQAAAEAGLPHAGVPGDLRARVEQVLQHEPEHPDPAVDWRFEPDPQDRRFGLGRFLWPHRGRLAAAVGLVAVEAVALQLGPVLTQIGIDHGITAGNRGVLIAAAAVYMALLGVAAAAGAVRVAFTGRLGERLMEKLRVRVFGHMQRQQMDFFTGERAGVLLARMTSDIEALSVLFQEGIVNFAVQALTLAVITVLLLYYDPLLALVTLAAAVPATVASSLWFRRRSAVNYRDVRNRIGELLGNLQESLAGIRVIAAFDRRAVNVAEHRGVVLAHRDANLRASKANALYAPGSDAIGVATQAVLLLVGGAMTASGRITVGELAAYLLFLTAFFAPVQALVQLYNSYQQGGAAIAKLRELFDTSPAVAQRPDAVALPPIEGEIAFDSVTFGYQADRPVLSDVTLRIAAGETLALVGPTGAGKTTLARLITRSFDPDSGTVSIDGRDLRDVTLHSLRSQIGVVPQEPFLFAGTVRDNVGFARPGAGDAELDAALEAVGITDVVQRLGGLDAVVHERGATLSAGERQLLALARAFMAQPRVLVLDEATSNLDLQSETGIERALDAVLEGRTAVIVAHRLATAQRADRIAVVEGGCIAEVGSHGELVAAGGRYATMFEVWERHSDESMTPSDAAGDLVLGLRGVSRTIDGTEVLRGIDWEVRAGQRWVVLGPNGSGKTTLVRIASMWEHPSSGSVEVLGERLGSTDVRRLRARVGFTSAAVADMLRPGLTATEVVMTAKHAALEPWWHTYDAADAQRASAALARVGCGHRADHRFGTLSSGERQRVLLARSLSLDPGVILLDEPNAGLDLAGREELILTLRGLALDTATPPLVLVTHHADEIPDGFTHALLLRAGAILAAGPIDETLTSASLSACFGLDLKLEHRHGRWTARAVP